MTELLKFLGQKRITTKKNGRKKMRKAYLIHGIPSKEKTCMSLEFQKIRRRGWKAYLKTRWVRTIPI